MSEYRNGQELEWPGRRSEAADILRGLPEGAKVSLRERLSTGGSGKPVEVGPRFNSAEMAWLLDPIQWPLKLSLPEEGAEDE